MPGDNILSYNRRFRNATSEAYPGNRTPSQQRELVHMYSRGLRKEVDARTLIADDWPATLEQCFTRVSARDRENERYHHLGHREVPMEVDAIKPSPSDSKLEKFMEVITSKLAKLEVQQKMASQDQPRSRYHIPVPRTAGSAADRKSNRYTADGKPICRYCGKVGHMWRECRKRLRDQGQWGQGRDQREPRSSQSPKN